MKEEKDTMGFVEEIREEVLLWRESEESEERAEAVAIAMEILG